MGARQGWGGRRCQLSAPAPRAARRSGGRPAVV